jgi:hypothetical protein
MIRKLLQGSLAVLFAMAVFHGQAAFAEGDGAAAPDIAAGSITIELNKVEQTKDACRAYLLFENPTKAEFTDFRLDLVLFDKSGVISRRVAVDASPLRADKSVVKLFDLANLQCDKVSRVLLNDITPCKAGGKSRSDCVDLVSVRSLNGIKLFK